MEHRTRAPLGRARARRHAWQLLTPAGRARAPPALPAIWRRPRARAFESAALHAPLPPAPCLAPYTRLNAAPPWGLIRPRARLPQPAVAAMHLSTQPRAPPPPHWKCIACARALGNAALGRGPASACVYLVKGTECAHGGGGACARAAARETGANGPPPMGVPNNWASSPPLQYRLLPPPVHPSLQHALGWGAGQGLRACISSASRRPELTSA